jgi:hypothetical protein
MRLIHAQNHHKESDLVIDGWSDGVLKPKNMNIAQLNGVYTKALVHINRKQFLQRRRNN